MEHFNEDMFMNSYKKKLVWNALPTHFPKPDYAFRKESKNSAHHRQQKCSKSQYLENLIKDDLPNLGVTNLHSVWVALIIMKFKAHHFKHQGG
jgi:hypothetical protein